MELSDVKPEALKIPLNDLECSLGYQNLAYEWLAGDGSDRSYFRIRSPHDGKSWVLMQLGPDDERMLKNNEYCWVHLAKYLLSHGVRTPEVTRQWPEYGTILIEDCGNELFEGHVLQMLRSSSFDKVMDLYRQAFHMIGGFLTSPSEGEESWKHRCFDKEKFNQELHFFRAKYLQDALNLYLIPAEMSQFQIECATLSEELSKESCYLVHRDFHSRNIMVQGDSLISIDFQDARLGPASYDLVSLCFDPYVPIEFGDRTALLTEGRSILRDLCPPSILDNIDRTWQKMALQRLLKAIGSYGYLSARKKDPGWLEYVRPSLQMIHGLGHERFPFLSGDLPSKILRRLKK